MAAYAAAKGSQLELAQLFGVSLGWVEKVYRQQRLNGNANRVEQRHGPVSRVDAAAKLIFYSLSVVSACKLSYERGCQEKTLPFPPIRGG